ncbi:MAG TPA: metallophosphoesterase family protein [Candidatus Omnitrophota bacterium]|nr:metallophosphoesterase family protein [Candidatus Omnitrophota bacterium]
MKIGVIADTHSLDIPKEVLEAFKGVDLIIHAGDFCSLKDAEVLKKIKELKAVHGNMDDHEVRKEFPIRQVIDCAGVKIGLAHGHGASSHALAFVRKEFEKDKVDAVIFGHSHQPMNETIDGVLYFNPGSPNDKVHAPYNSYGLLEIKDGNVKAKIIKLK